MMGKPIHILIVEDDPTYVRFIEEILKESNRDRFQLIHVKRLYNALKCLEKGIIDAVLLDLNLPDSWGFDTFERLYKEFPLVPIVVLTGVADGEMGVKAVQKGAQDYLPKVEVDGNLLARTIRYAIERKRLIEELERSYRKFYNLSAHLQHLREEERKYIAAELHDELGGLFTALKMELFSAFDTPEKNQDSHSEMRDPMVALIDKGIDIVRRISSDLRPQILDSLGLLPAIEWYVEEFQKRARIRCRLTLSDGEGLKLKDEDIVLDRDRATAIFRIVQESLTNVVRHSRASRVSIAVKKKEDTLKIEVEDNGIGIDEEKISDPYSFGLLGIQERVLFLKGNVTIKGIPNKGTTVTVTVPLLETGRMQNDQGDYCR